jgi:AraC-like DNA-binding protein
VNNLAAGVHTLVTATPRFCHWHPVGCVSCFNYWQLRTMKTAVAFDQHLAIRELSLLPGAEWSPRFAGWLVVRVTSGACYWMQPQATFELGARTVAILSPRAVGVVRASQIAGSLLHFYTVQPERLTGVVTLGEEASLRNAALKEALSFRLFPPEAPAEARVGNVFDWHDGNPLQQRLQMIELLVGTLAEELRAERPCQAPQVSEKDRLERYLKDLPVSDLLQLDFGELVNQMHCTPRHVSRVFNSVVGASFREKQAEVRLSRALELLATTDDKMLDVALESGYQSLSLFNLMFKRRYGVTPSQWRLDLARRNGRTRARNNVALSKDVPRGLGPIPTAAVETATQARQAAG